MRLVLFGPSGAGKGTQAQLLKDQLGVVHIASGDLFRNHLRLGTPLGRQISEYVNQGLLVPDEVTIDIVLDKVMPLTSTAGFILDGFPRNTHQAEVLESKLVGEARGLDKVVAIDVPEAALVARLGSRYTCRQCQAPYAVAPGEQAPACTQCGGVLYQRPDDSPAAVQRRFQVYQQETLPVLAFYRKRGLLAEVSGVGTVEEVNGRVLTALGQGPAGRPSPKPSAKPSPKPSPKRSR